MLISLLHFIAEEGIADQRSPLWKCLVHVFDEAHHYIILQPHGRSCPKEIVQLQSGLAAGEREGEFFLIIRICNSDIEKIVSRSELIVLARSIEGEVL